MTRRALVAPETEGKRANGLELDARPLPQDAGSLSQVHLLRVDHACPPGAVIVPSASID